MVALKDKGLKAEAQVPLQVQFRGQVVGEFYADMVVENNVLMELKAAKALTPEHTAQILNYLKATGKETGLLVNFGTPRIEIRRFDNRSMSKGS